MRLILILSIYTIFWCQSFAQETVIQLKGQHLSDATTWFWPIRTATFELQPKEAHDPLLKYTLASNNFFWDSTFHKNQYYPINYIISPQNDVSIIKFDQNDSKDFSESATYQIGDTVQLKFKRIDHQEELIVPSQIKPDQKKGFRFDIDYFHTSKILLEQDTNFITIWPFQEGVKINVDTTVQFNKGELPTYYNLNESFNYGNHTYRFKNYDYLNQKITLEKSPKSKKLFGYKKDNYLSPHLETLLNTSKHDLTVIYFGGKWCSPCLEENPKLQKLEQFIKRKNGHLISYMARHQETDQEINDYVKEQHIAGEVRIVDLKSENSILKQMNIDSFPFYLVIDKKSKIIFRADNTKQSVHHFLYERLSKK